MSIYIYFIDMYKITFETYGASYTLSIFLSETKSIHFKHIMPLCRLWNKSLKFFFNYQVKIWLANLACCATIYFARCVIGIMPSITNNILPLFTWLGMPALYGNLWSMSVLARMNNNLWVSNATKSFNILYRLVKSTQMK